MRITYRDAARDDVIRQFRYYLVTLNLPDVALRFRKAVKQTSRFIAEHPQACPLYRLDNPRFETLRSWPVIGFKAIRFYFLAENDAVVVIRLLHGKRNVREILNRENK